MKALIGHHFHDGSGPAPEQWLVGDHAGDGLTELCSQAGHKLVTLLQQNQQARPILCQYQDTKEDKSTQLSPLIAYITSRSSLYIPYFIE